MVEPSVQVHVNLRVLSKIKAGDRLQTVDSRFFGIDRGYLTWITRWLRSDNRANTVDRVEETFRQAKEMNVDSSLVNAAREGVRELCATYVGDETTVARLETVIGNIELSNNAREF